MPTKEARRRWNKKYDQDKARVSIDQSDKIKIELIKKSKGLNSVSEVITLLLTEYDK